MSLQFNSIRETITDFEVLIWALIIASATLNGLGKGLISRWLREPVDLSALPEGNKIFGVADDVIEALICIIKMPHMRFTHEWIPISMVVKLYRSTSF
jgi:hypothetical protein